jgi:hypothetical protein
VGVTIPRCLQNGEYLLRAEHIALHSAGSAGGAQFYISCAQLSGRFIFCSSCPFPRQSHFSNHMQHLGQELNS